MKLYLIRLVNLDGFNGHQHYIYTDIKKAKKELRRVKKTIGIAYAWIEHHELHPEEVAK